MSSYFKRFFNADTSNLANAREIELLSSESAVQQRILSAWTFPDRKIGALHSV